MKITLIRVLVIAAAVLAILSALVYFNAEHIVFYMVSRAGDINISYGRINSSAFKIFDFTDLAISDRKTGAGFVAKTAVLEPTWDNILSGKISFWFKLNDVNFIKWAPEAADDYKTLPGLIAVPFNSKWRYQEITGSIRMTRAGMRIEDLLAKSDIIKLSVSGIIQKNSDIDADITVYFSDALFAKIPKNFVKMVLKDEDDGWQSLSVKLTGNYQIPSIEISSKTFRLNIGLLKDQK